MKLLLKKLIGPTKVRELSHYKSFFMAICHSMSCYSKEIFYFFRAKLCKPVTADNQELLIRKRAHHLERYLFKPKAYPIGQGRSIAEELETLIDNYGAKVSTKQLKWTKRILREFHEGTGVECLCQSIIKGARRSALTMNDADLMSLLEKRRMRRNFLNVPLAQKERMKISKAAQWAPSSCNRQPLELIFVERAELKAFIASTIPGGRQFFNDAPCIIIFVCDARDYRFPDERMNPFVDGAAAIQNICLLCETMELGCCWGTYYSFGAIENEAEVRKKCSIPSTHLIVGSLAIGKSQQSVCDIPRDPAEIRYGINKFRGKEGE